MPFSFILAVLISFFLISSVLNVKVFRAEHTPPDCLRHQNTAGHLRTGRYHLPPVTGPCCFPSLLFSSLLFSSLQFSSLPFPISLTALLPPSQVRWQSPHPYHSTYIRPAGLRKSPCPPVRPASHIPHTASHSSHR